MGPTNSLQEGLQVSFNGNLLSYSIFSAGSNFINYYAADISAFQGQSGELRFTILPKSPLFGVMLDDILFCPTAIPEPSVISLSALGLLLLGRHLRSAQERGRRE